MESVSTWRACLCENFILRPKYLVLFPCKIYQREIADDPAHIAHAHVTTPGVRILSNAFRIRQLLYTSPQKEVSCMAPDPSLLHTQIS